MKKNGGEGVFGFLVVLTLVLVALKALGFVSWGWIAVLSPLWGPLALILVIALGMIFFTLRKEDEK